MKPEQLKRIAEYMGYEAWITDHALFRKPTPTVYIKGPLHSTEYTGTTPEQSMELLKMLLKNSDREEFLRQLLWDIDVNNKEVEEIILDAAWEHINGA